MKLKTIILALGAGIGIFYLLDPDGFKSLLARKGISWPGMTIPVGGAGTVTYYGYPSGQGQGGINTIPAHETDHAQTVDGVEQGNAAGSVLATYPYPAPNLPYRPHMKLPVGPAPVQLAGVAPKLILS